MSLVEAYYGSETLSLIVPWYEGGDIYTLTGGEDVSTGRRTV
jgi:hypothetical protein